MTWVRVGKRPNETTTAAERCQWLLHCGYSCGEQVPQSLTGCILYLTSCHSQLTGRGGVRSNNQESVG